MGFTAAGVLAVIMSPNTFGLPASHSPDEVRITNKPHHSHAKRRHAAKAAASHKIVEFAPDSSLPALPATPLPRSEHTHSHQSQAARIASGGSMPSFSLDSAAVAADTGEDDAADQLAQADVLAASSRLDDADTILRTFLSDVSRREDHAARAQALWRLAKNQFARARIAKV